MLAPLRIRIRKVIFQQSVNFNDIFKTQKAHLNPVSNLPFTGHMSMAFATKN